MDPIFAIESNELNNIVQNNTTIFIEFQLMV